MISKSNTNEINNITIRKVQAFQGERSLTIVLPKEFAVVLGIVKGDYLKVSIVGTQIVMEKADI
jgi:antitoxin component of MazEF toxin-antitoxin module